MSDHGSRRTLGPGSSGSRFCGPKRWPTPTKSSVPCNFCLTMFSTKSMVEAPVALHTPFMHPIPWGWRVLGWNPPKNLPALKDQLLAKFQQDLSSGVGFLWKHTQIALYLVDKLTVKVSDHNTRSTLGPGPSRSRFGVQKGDPPPLNQRCPTTFVL